MNKRPIGIFDSGVGGLTVVDKIFRLLPNEKIIYFVIYWNIIHYS